MTIWIQIFTLTRFTHQTENLLTFEGLRHILTTTFI